MSLNINPKTNAYRSSKSVIVSGPGTMYNEITRPKQAPKQYNANTNTYDVTIPYMKSTVSRKRKSSNRPKSEPKSSNNHKSTRK